MVGGLLLWAGGCWPGPSIEEVDIGVDVRVNAVIAVPHEELGLFAAVAGGVIVDGDGRRRQLSSHELWAIASDTSGRFWVCGERGYLAFADVEDSRDETSWTPVNLGIDADLFGLAAKGSQVVVVGDETLWMGSEVDGERQWIEPTPPSDGWGQLRAASFVTVNSQEQVIVVGLDGRALVSAADDASFSVADGLEPGVDYTRACETLVLGEGLAHARWTGDGWVTGGGGEAADYVACGRGYVLSSDRWISKLTDNSKLDRLYRLPWQGWALDSIFGVYVAGDAGHVALWAEGGPQEF